MPGVKIGDNVIIGNNTIINKNVPDGCLFAGQPGKIIRNDIYPPETSQKEKEKILDGIIEDYIKLCHFKDFKPEISRETMSIIYTSPHGMETLFNVSERTVNGDINDHSEDFRDYLRFRGVKFFTDRPFKSLRRKDFDV